MLLIEQAEKYNTHILIKQAEKGAHQCIQAFQKSFHGWLSKVLNFE